MGEQDPRRQRRARLWAAIGAALLVIALVIVLGIMSRDDSPGPLPPTTGPTSTRPQETEVRDSTSLTVPETVRTARGSFESVEGQKYLLRFEVSTTKPEESPGAAMYLGVSLNCASEDGGEADSAGGTQNLISGEPTTMRNQFMIRGDGGQQSCNVSVSAPNPDVAAAGTTVEIDVHWSAQPIDARSFEVDSDERLPMSVPTDSRGVVFSRTVDLEDVRGRRVNVLSTLHLTACTGVNGSREDGRVWCDAATVDTEGSEVDVILRADLLDAGGSPCGVVDVHSDALHINRFTHHRLVDIAQYADVPSDSCGSVLRVSLTVGSDGPAPVVVHSSASSFVVAVDGGSSAGRADAE